MGLEKISYSERVERIKCLLESMKEMEEAFYFLEDCSDVQINSIKWETENAEIKIDEIDPERELFYVTVSTWPKKSRGKKFKSKTVYYFYKIEEEGIEREISFWPESSPIKSVEDKEKEKILGELTSILYSKKLTLKIEGGKKF